MSEWKKTMTATLTETLAIRYTFGLFAEQAATAVPMFFQRLFEIAPQVRPMFPGELSGHQRKFTMMMVWLVERLDQPEQLIPALRDLGARHHRYGVSSAMFAPTGEALLYTLERVLGDEYTPEVEACWVSLFGTITLEMQRGAEACLKGNC